jgi:hypothetical protein
MVASEEAGDAVGEFLHMQLFSNLLSSEKTRDLWYHGFDNYMANGKFLALSQFPNKLDLSINNSVPYG